jgi:ATP synthase protein I
MEEMKVQNDLRCMFKKVLIFDVVIGITLVILTQWLFRNYSLVVLLGLGIAFINFIANGMITEYALLNKTIKYKIIAFISFITRVVIVCVIALVLFKINKFNVVAYMLGYSLQFISLTLYGII